MHRAVRAIVVKLLLYSHFFAPGIGGVETIVLSLARGLAELRASGGAAEFDVTVITQMPAGSFDDSALPFRTVRRPGLLQLWRLIRVADVLHIAGPALAPLILSYLARRPVVLEHHGYQAICPNGLLLFQPDRSACPGHFEPGRYLQCLRCNAQDASVLSSLRLLLLTFLRRALSRRVAANLAISHHVLNRHRLPRSAVVYYGIEDPLQSALPSMAAGRGARELCFAYVGRFVVEKALPVLLEAADHLRKDGLSFEVRLIGDGPERANVEALVRRRSLESVVHMTGFLSGDALLASLQTVDVVIMPTIMEETAGLAVIDQMMRGKLVIVSEIGGLGEVVGPAGLKFTPGDAEALAACMRRVIDRPALIEELGAKARERAVRLFQRDCMISAHAQVYRSLFSAARR